jgi:dipeptidyl aminopeptidase/acylaminoacyl peptidase
VLAAYDPVWSPDGTKIAFYGYPRGAVQGGANYDVYVMSADGSGVANLTTTPADVASWFSQLNPKWSPDGTRIAYDGDDGLYVVNVDSSGPTRIASGQDATWSPDGTRIAFGGQGGIFAVSPDGNGLVQLKSGPGFDEFPAFSPDGSRIAYQHSQGDERAIYIMNVDGSNPSRVADFQGDTMGRPVWSPDGSMLSFDLYLTDQTWDIYAVNSDGSGLAVLAGDPNTDELAPVWSPDGTRIAFHASDVLARDTNNTGTFDIYLMNPDGRDQIPLTHDLGTSGGSDVHWQELSGAPPSTWRPPTFAPAAGWYVKSTGPVPIDSEVLPESWAANVQFVEEDLRVSERLDQLIGWPSATMKRMPPEGVVIVTWIESEVSASPNEGFPERDLPLQLADAEVQREWEGQVAPNVPFHWITATVNGHHVEVRVFFGTLDPSPDTLQAAQDELDRLVVPE